jgi:hypothetical protein
VVKVWLRLRRSAPSATLREAIQENSMPANKITAQIIHAADKVHTAMWPGLLESVYAVALDLGLERFKDSIA